MKPKPMSLAATALAVTAALNNVALPIYDGAQLCFSRDLCTLEQPALTDDPAPQPYDLALGSNGPTSILESSRSSGPAGTANATFSGEGRLSVSTEILPAKA